MFNTHVDGTKVKSLSDSGNMCSYGSQRAEFVLTSAIGKIRMCLTRVLFKVLVCGNCPYPDPLGAERPKKNYVTKIQVYVREQEMRLRNKSKIFRANNLKLKKL